MSELCPCSPPESFLQDPQRIDSFLYSCVPTKKKRASLLVVARTRYPLCFDRATSNTNKHTSTEIEWLWLQGERAIVAGSDADPFPVASRS